MSKISRYEQLKINVGVKRKVVLHEDNIDKEKSVLYAMGKRRNNNPKKIATISYTNGDKIKLSIINDFKVKSIFGGWEINTSKNKIPMEYDKKIKKILSGNKEYSIKSTPTLLIDFNGSIITVKMNDFYEVNYNKKAIRDFVDRILNENRYIS